MAKIFTYINLHLRLKINEKFKINKKATIISLIFKLLIFATFFYLMKYFFDILIDEFGNKISIENISIVIFTVFGCIFFFLSLSLQIKQLFKPFDFVISARFPMSCFQKYIAELIVIYINLLLASIIYVVPTMILFGISSNAITSSYVLYAILSSLFVPLVPFSLALIFAVPIVFIVSKLENKNILKTILFVVFFLCVFILYSYVLNLMADYYIHQTISVDFETQISHIFTALNNKYNICVYMNNICFNINLLNSLTIIVIVSLSLFLIGIICSLPIFNKMSLQIINSNNNKFGKITKVNNNSFFKSIFIKEFKSIIRTPVYAYFYIGIAISTPIMVFVCSYITKKIGEAQIGTSIYFGTIILVLLFFMSLINSFSASIISRENKQFYLTKIIPVVFKKQLFAKLCVYLLVSVLGLIFSTFILCILNIFNLIELLVLFLSSALFSFGLIYQGVNINLRHPNIKNIEFEEEDESNVVRLLTIGIILSAIIGILNIVLLYALDFTIVLILDISLTFIYCLINIIVFSKKAEKRYMNIEYH